MVSAFLHVLISSFLETSRRQIVASVTVRFSGSSSGKPTAIFVGALSSHGTPSDPASLAAYSNYAGADQQVQEQFLVVGVTGGSLGSGGTNLYGTSFAAPQVAGYAAILGSKFTTATPLQITDQLLDTARTDTILGYDIARHGQGEASLSRALAPYSIN